MFIVEDYGLAILFCIVIMLCWGSWANTTKLTIKAWQFGNDNTFKVSLIHD